jgi:hypothetical protein
VRSLSPLLLLIALAFPHDAHAVIRLENRVRPNNVETRRLVTRLENVLTQTEKRIREVFGFKLDMKAVVEPSKTDYDFQFKPEDPKQADVLLINSRVVRTYATQDLQIAAARALYQAIWPKFRKLTASAPGTVQRMYDEGMTAYAAELLYPGAPPWKYAGLYGKEGREQYRKYLSIEKDLAEEALQSLSSGTTKELDASGRLLSYRLMKTFEKDMDPKMIQLMDIAEFEQRMRAGLEVLKQGFRGHDRPIPT